MSKTITVQFKKLEKIFDLLKKSHECAGTLIVKKDNVVGYTISKGSSDSVRTPLSKWNWHSHPLFLYARENVCWGWPSGEDLREVILFALGGNSAHFVFSLEGVYVLKVTPCFRKWLVENVKDPWDRGLFIAVLEMVFKSTHNLRTNSYNKIYNITPADWINMVHRLRIKFFFQKTPSTTKDPCGKITCRNITTHDSGARGKEVMSIENYAQVYEGNSLTVYKIGVGGALMDTKKMSIGNVLKRLEVLGRDLEEACPNAKMYKIDFILNSGLPSNFLKMKYESRIKLYRSIETTGVYPPKRSVRISY